MEFGKDISGERRISFQWNCYSWLTVRGTDLSETSTEAWRKGLIKAADCHVPEKLNEVRLCEAVRVCSSY